MEAMPFPEKRHIPAAAAHPYSLKCRDRIISSTIAHKEVVRIIADRFECLFNA